MSKTPSTNIELADAISNLMYSIAGWLLIGLGILSTLGAVGGLIQASSAAETFAPLLLFGLAIIFIFSGVFVSPSFRQRLNRRHDKSRFGRIRTVDNRAFDQAENVEETCVSCDVDITGGLVRRYREEYAFAGIPIWTISEDHNYYCASCGLKETSGPSQKVPGESTHNRELESEIK